MGYRKAAALIIQHLIQLKYRLNHRIITDQGNTEEINNKILRCNICGEFFQSKRGKSIRIRITE
jgi:hypothetical protein